MKEEKVEFEFEGKKHYVVLRELTGGEFDSIIDEVMEVTVSTGAPTMKMKWGKYRKLLILKSIKEASFKVTIDEISRLPREVYEKLFEKASELNPFR